MPSFPDIFIWPLTIIAVLLIPSLIEIIKPRRIKLYVYTVFARKFSLFRECEWVLVKEIPDQKLLWKKGQKPRFGRIMKVLKETNELDVKGPTIEGTYLLTDCYYLGDFFNEKKR